MTMDRLQKTMDFFKKQYEESPAPPVVPEFNQHDRPGFFGNMPIVKINQPKFCQKLKVRNSVEMTDEFRAEINKWLADTFGYRPLKDEELIMPPGRVLVTSDQIIADADTANILQERLRGYCK